MTTSVDRHKSTEAEDGLVLCLQVSLLQQNKCTQYPNITSGMNDVFCGEFEYHVQ